MEPDLNAVIEFLQGQEQAAYFHLWNVKTGLDTVTWYAQWGDLQLHHPNLSVLLCDLKRYWEKAQDQKEGA